MKPNLPKILTILILFFSFSAHSQEIWYEGFSIPEKGIWGDQDGITIHSDFEEITNWTLNFSNANLSGSDDYSKTVSTSGGRFECRDTNGEIVWCSEEINISEYKNIKIELLAKETGSGANVENKYLKACFILDKDEEILFEISGENRGNWGSEIAKQTNLNGEKLSIVVYLNNHYTADKVILDEVLVTGEERNPVTINPGDVLLNEVLFNPVPGGHDFVEIYNISDKHISLNKLYLASRDKNLELEQIYSLSNEKINFEPESYLALTKDSNGVFPWFTINCTECFLQMDKFPSYNNNEDYVVLLNADLDVIDEFFYTDKMHTPLLYDHEGISLERISLFDDTNGKNNWHSASTESGYGTPGYLNSQFENANFQKVKIAFEPDAFSPNNDGYNDIYTINFQLDKPGYIANIWIFDSSGRRVRQLCKNNILGTSDQIKWNGEDASGQRLKLGAYIVLVEIYNTQGFVKQFKDSVILTDILE